MRVLAAATHEASPEEFLAQPFASSEVFLGFLSHLAEKRPDEPVIAIVDELPYLADVDQGLLTARQNWWDEHKRQPNLKLFLAGSSIAFIERQVLDANAPLYNRRTGALKLEPLDYAEAARLFPRYSPREKIEAYAVLGGMPSYLKQFNSDKDLDENLLVTALQRNTYKDSSNESWHASSSRSTNMSRARPSRRFADNSCGVLTSPADYPLGSTSTPSEPGGTVPTRLMSSRARETPQRW